MTAMEQIRRDLERAKWYIDEALSEAEYVIHDHTFAKALAEISEKIGRYVQFLKESEKPH